MGATTKQVGKTRERMLWSAVALLQERGANALTVDAVLAHSGAPRGSVYHHFPGGKEQILAEATRLGGEFISAMIEQAGTAPEEAVDQFVDFWKRSMVDSDFNSGCPVAAVVIDGHRASEEVATIARDAFTAWTDAVRSAYVRGGLGDEVSGALASVTLSLVEGALIQARILRSLEPLDDAGAALKRMIALPA